MEGEYLQLGVGGFLAIAVLEKVFKFIKDMKGDVPVQKQPDTPPATNTISYDELNNKLLLDMDKKMDIIATEIIKMAGDH